MQDLHAPLPKKFIVESSIADIMHNGITNTLVSVVRSLDKSENFNSVVVNLSKHYETPRHFSSRISKQRLFGLIILVHIKPYTLMMHVHRG